MVLSAREIGARPELEGGYMQAFARVRRGAGSRAQKKGKLGEILAQPA
jgi:hypothetical protein